ncbi:MAG: hypothetical protein U0174_15855 [Polyangiaceae bacterium]
MVRHIVLLAALLVTACAGAEEDSEDGAEDELRAAKVGVNDVSILFPLPKRGATNRLLGASAEGRGGELLPQSVFAKIPPLVFGQSPYERLYVTSVRIDPCFAALTDQGAACKNQIRMVLQPIADGDATSAPRAEDAALHVFYSITRDDLAAFTKRYLSLKKAAGSFVSAPLGVHPLLKKDPNSAFAQGLKKLLLEFAGRGNLSRVTFLTREPPREGTWTMGGFDIRNGDMTRMKVATLGQVETQTLRNSGFASFGFDIAPPPVATDDIKLLLNSVAAVQAPRATAQKAQLAALRIENPLRHTPDTIDCASCHLTHGRQAVEAKFGFSPVAPDAFSQTRLSLKGANNTSGDNLHAFSYLDITPTVSQRVVNESASVADYINNKVLK